jgi:hypothetical protein
MDSAEIAIISVIVTIVGITVSVILSIIFGIPNFISAYFSIMDHSNKK